MKLKNLLIICMIFGFFMAAAVSPAVAQDFSAKVSMITDFNASVNLMPSTKDVDATPDIVELTVYDGKAVVSPASRKVHVGVTGYNRNMKSSDIVLEYYNADGGDLSLNAQIAPQGFKNASSTACDFTLPTLYQENQWLNWIRVTVKDQDGHNPVYAWVMAKVITIGSPNSPYYIDALDAGDFIPDVTYWDDYPLFLCNSVNITLTDPTDDVYIWLKYGKGKVQTVIAESEELAKTTDLTVFYDDFPNSDPNFSIVYTNSSYDTNTFAKLDVSVDTTVRRYFDDSNDLNLLTGYEASTDTYYLYVPKYTGLDTTTDSAPAVVYYRGANITIDTTTDVKIGSFRYFRLTLNKALLDAVDPSDDLAQDWTYNKSKVVYEQVLTENVEGTPTDHRYVAGPDDGVGPRLLNAAISYNNNRKVTLTFSEDIKASLINGAGLHADIQIGADLDYISITDATVNSTAPNKIVVTTNKDVEQGKDVNLKDATADTIQDLSGNSAYRLNTAVPTSVERIVEKVAVIDVNRIGIDPDTGYFTGSTFINVYFDRDMSGDNTTLIDPMAYFVEPKPGLPEDPNGTATVVSVTYNENTTPEYFVTLEVDGVIASTAEADLPAVKIIRDVKGGTPSAPIAAEDRDVFIPAEDKIGPYLSSASFSLNPENGKTPADLLDAEKATLTLVFSEPVSDENLAASSFTPNPKWNTACLDNAYITGVNTSTLVLTLDDDASTGHIPFSPGGDTYTIAINDKGDIEDGKENELSDFLSGYTVTILDTTPVWVKSCEITEFGGNLRITSVFGKKVAIDTDITTKSKNLIKVANGDPNIEAISKADYSITVDVSSDQPTDWTPTVTFDLAPDTAIEDATAAADYTANDLTTDFSVVPVDKIPARIKNADAANQIEAFTTLTENLGGGKYRYTVEVPFVFTEPVNPDIWGTPADAWKYFDASPDYSVNSFVISGVNSCSGNRLTVKILSNVSVDAGVWIKFDNSPAITDKNKNTSDLNDVTYKLKSGVLKNVWTVPTDVTADIVSPSYMKIKGYVYDATGDAWKGADDAVYAFSRNQLFVKETSGDEVLKVSYAIDHNKCYGAGIVQENGSYHMNVYGGTKGFANGEPVILIFHDDSAGTDVICTTACLSNTAYSVRFQGGYTPTVVDKDIYLGKREAVIVKPGWNLVSSSIGTAYVDPVVCADTGLNPSDYNGYIYGPGDSLTGAGSLPSNTYTLSSSGNRDSSALLFTISHPDLQNSIFAPYSAYGIADGLDDTLNNLPVFGPGLAFYIYIDEDIADPASTWEIVLFGDKVPGPEYMVKVPSNTALVGHWGNLMYHTENGQTTASNLNGGTELPSTYTAGNFYYVDGISLGAGSNSAATLFAVTVTDVAGATFEAISVGTYFNNTQNVGPAVWWGSPDLIDLSDLTVVPPGCGAWIQIDGPDAGPYFINYMKPAE